MFLISYTYRSCCCSVTGFFFICYYHIVLKQNTGAWLNWKCTAPCWEYQSRNRRMLDRFSDAIGYNRHYFNKKKREKIFKQSNKYMWKKHKLVQPIDVHFRRKTIWANSFVILVRCAIAHITIGVNFIHI